MHLPAEVAEVGVVVDALGQLLVVSEHELALARREHSRSCVEKHPAQLPVPILATAQPDPERAVELGLRCIAIAGSAGSARITKELRTPSAR